MKTEFIYITKVTRLEMLTVKMTQEEEFIVEEHFNYLSRLRDKNEISLAGRTLNNDEKTFGIVIINSTDLEKAMEIMKNDPAVKKGIMTAEIFPFRTAIK